MIFGGGGREGKVVTVAPINSSRNYGCKVQRRKRPDSRNNVGRKIRGHGRPITRKNADRNFMGRGSRLLLIRPNLLIRSLLIPAKTTGYFCSASKHRFLASDDRVDFLFFFRVHVSISAETRRESRVLAFYRRRKVDISLLECDISTYSL